MAIRFVCKAYPVILAVLKHNNYRTCLYREQFAKIFLYYYKDEFIRHNLDNNVISVEYQYNNTLYKIHYCNNSLSLHKLYNTYHNTDDFTYDEFQSMLNFKIITNSNNGCRCTNRSLCSTTNKTIVYDITELYNIYKSVVDGIIDEHGFTMDNVHNSIKNNKLPLLNNKTKPQVLQLFNNFMTKYAEYKKIHEYYRSLLKKMFELVKQEDQNRIDLSAAIYNIDKNIDTIRNTKININIISYNKLNQDLKNYIIKTINSQEDNFKLRTMIYDNEKLRNAFSDKNKKIKFEICEHAFKLFN